MPGTESRVAGTQRQLRVLSDEVVRASLLLSFLLCLLFSAKELWHVHIPAEGRLG